MRNFVQRGDTLTIPAPSNVVSGAGVQAGSIFGVAAEDCAAGFAVDLDVTGVFTLPKPTVLALGIGDPVYWDATGKQVTATATGNRQPAHRRGGDSGSKPVKRRRRAAQRFVLGRREAPQHDHGPARRPSCQLATARSLPRSGEPVRWRFAGPVRPDGR